MWDGNQSKYLQYTNIAIYNTATPCACDEEDRHAGEGAQKQKGTHHSANDASWLIGGRLLDLLQPCLGLFVGGVRGLMDVVNLRSLLLH